MTDSENISTLEEGFHALYKLLWGRIPESSVNAHIKEWKPANNVVYRDDIFQGIMNQYAMSESEKFVLLIALAPVLHPELLECLSDAGVMKFTGKGVVGGYSKNPSRAFLPTCRTVIFLLGENSDDQLYSYFTQDHFFFKTNILSLGNLEEGIPIADAPIMLSEEYYHLFTTGIFQPRHSSKFPATRIDTEMSWEDLIIHDHTMAQVTELKDWLNFETQILETKGIKKWLKRGFRAMFYGPSGTGKSMTASLLGKHFGIPVYRTDLSMIVSKYIGETEKNMESLFNVAENKGWILFFDEAESLFGKRSSVSDANDRFANQEISYLLQRIENYNGMVILASNKLFDIDEAFKRRFQSIIEFPEPGPEERKKLWKNMFGNTGFGLEKEIDLEEIASQYRMTGGVLINVLRSSSLKALTQGNNYFTKEDIISGMKKEYQKHGWMWVEPQPKKSIKLQMKVSTPG
jgi:AAA+ superfamily predicted ATPase